MPAEAIAPQAPYAALVGEPAVDELTRLAEQAVDLAQSRPQEARQLADRVIGAKRRGGPAAPLATAERALGQVALLLEEHSTARYHLTRSIRYARVAHDRHGEAEARLSRAFCFANEGRFRAAFVELDRAEVDMGGNDQDMGRLHNQRALVWWLKGGYEQALPHFGHAAARSRRCGDELNLVRVLINRGVLLGRLGSYTAARRDLTRAEELAHRLHRPLLVAVIHQDLGWVATQRGDVPAALRFYDRAERDYEPHGAELGSLLLDRCDVLLGARLLAEAAETAERALRIFAEGGAVTSVPEARLYLAEARLLGGDRDAAGGHARAAIEEFARQDRPAWAALARYALLRAQLLDDRTAPQDARRAALRAAADLESSGLADQALDARIVAARLALRLGRVAVAKRELAAASAARNRGTVERRTRAWHAEALLRLAAGDRTRARSALRTGLRILEDHRAMLGATDLRAAASAHRVEIARLGFQMSIEDGRAAEALRWVERSRAGLVRQRTVHPPDDEVLARSLAQLRATIGEVDSAVRAGAKTAGLRAQQAKLERVIRNHSRSLPAGNTGIPAPPPVLSALSERLAGRAVIEYVVHEEALYALVFVDGRASVHRLGPSAPVESAARVLGMLLDRVARNLGDAARRQRNADQLFAQARTLDDLLLAPLDALVSGRELVVVPTGAVGAVPWFALPSTRGRPVSVAPSATVWYEAAEKSPARGGSTILASGPGLPDSETEVRRVAELYPDCRMLVGADASVHNTLAALDGAALAHVAAHGDFRTDNPLFSALWLADGPLTIYDLEGIAVAPRAVVLAACDSARHTSQPGDDLLGLAAAFLSLGTKVLIASLVSLPDGPSSGLMHDLHTRLSSGQRPAAALAATQQQAASGDVHAFAAAAGFVCFGAG